MQSTPILQSSNVYCTLSCQCNQSLYCNHRVCYIYVAVWTSNSRSSLRRRHQRLRHHDPPLPVTWWYPLTSRNRRSVCTARCVAITRPASIMAYGRARDARVSSRYELTILISNMYNMLSELKPLKFLCVRHCMYFVWCDMIYTMHIFISCDIWYYTCIYFMTGAMHNRKKYNSIFKYI